MRLIPKLAAYRCLRALCMLRSAAISFKHGGCLTSKSKAIRRIGWALCAHWRFYINFFTHHYIGDYRWYLAAFALGLYARTTVLYTPYDTTRKMPLLLAFVLIGFFIWLAENLGTLFGVWRYPNQIGAWASVHISKWSSWALLVMMTFTIVANLKHIKHTISVSKD